MEVVLVEFFNGDETEAMVFRTLETLVEFFEFDLYYDPDSTTGSEEVESLKRQIKAHQKSGYDIMDIDLLNITGHSMRIYSQYPLG